MEGGAASFHDIGSSTDWVVMVVYFVGIMLFGSYFGRYTSSTSDFFFGGRRFSWWLITMSIVATGIGSHSFIKYSAKGFEHGLSSSITYLNDWFLIPFFMFGWLPIIVYSRVRSIPEYFEKRFSPSARFLATLLLLVYMIGYIGIGFLTLGKALIPMLPEAFTLLGQTIPVTLMGAIVVIAVITGIYITFGGQTAVIFTDLLQGFILLGAGFMLFGLGLAHLGGFEAFWDLLPTAWKLPLPDFNRDPSFNFAGIFWQDGIAGSIGFLFMNQGLMMRFMACRSVHDGRKAAATNILLIMPLSAVVVGNAGWIGKAISVTDPGAISPGTSPDQIFVVVANIIASPGVFGFIMASLTAALMSTVDTLINATAAIFINDVYRPLKRLMQRGAADAAGSKSEDRRELTAARWASVGITILGVLAVLAFRSFPTVYEAHGYFHSTLTPPLVVAIFFGVFWRRFTPAAVITTFVGGVALMILGARFPELLIAPFDHGVELVPERPYSYIRALYNLIVCSGVGVLVTLSSGLQRQIAAGWKAREGGGKGLVAGLTLSAAVAFVGVVAAVGPMGLQLGLALVLIAIVPLVVTFAVPYDEAERTRGLTSWSIDEAKRGFKGAEPNEVEGQQVKVRWRVEGEEEVVRFSAAELERMAAAPGDLVYLCDRRAWLGGLKSIHATIGAPHDEPGVVRLSPAQARSGLFVEGRELVAVKEM
jgi:SSS family solute:Na+ symporter